MASSEATALGTFQYIIESQQEESIRGEPALLNYDHEDFQSIEAHRTMDLRDIGRCPVAAAMKEVYGEDGEARVIEVAKKMQSPQSGNSMMDRFRSKTGEPNSSSKTIKPVENHNPGTTLDKEDYNPRSAANPEEITQTLASSTQQEQERAQIPPQLQEIATDVDEIRRQTDEIAADVHESLRPKAEQVQKAQDRLEEVFQEAMQQQGGQTTESALEELATITTSPKTKQPEPKLSKSTEVGLVSDVKSEETEPSSLEPSLLTMVPEPLVGRETTSQESLAATDEVSSPESNIESNMELQVVESDSEEAAEFSRELTELFASTTEESTAIMNIDREVTYQAEDISELENVTDTYETTEQPPSLQIAEKIIEQLPIILESPIKLEVAKELHTAVSKALEAEQPEITPEIIELLFKLFDDRSDQTELKEILKNFAKENTVEELLNLLIIELLPLTKQIDNQQYLLTNLHKQYYAGQANVPALNKLGKAVLGIFNSFSVAA